MRQRLGVLGTLLALIAVVAMPAQAQNGTLSGTVVSSDSGQPLAGAQVQVLGGGVETGGVTGAGGRFRFDVGAGTYRLIVTFLGYRTHSQEGVSISAGQTTSLALLLVSDVISLNGLVVTPSRGIVQKQTDSPATVFTVGQQEIEDRPAVTPTDHLRTTPGVDIVTQGVQASNVVIRGFNNIFSGSLQALTDNRIAGLPSLRVNLLHFIPSINDDIERIEVVLGPGSALYGPNTANGVLHIITKSPLNDPGTTMSLGGGEQSVLKGSFRTSHKIGENFGIKVSGQYVRGDEWVFVDEVETANRAIALADPAAFKAALIGRGAPGPVADLALSRVGVRDYSLERFSLDARADWRVADDGVLSMNYGRTNTSGIELTGIGAGQTEDWIYQYAQVRLNKGRFFAQTYLNTSDAGNSFLLRDGLPLVDESRLFVAQLQYGFPIADGREDITFGMDYYYTNPRTQGTINGINENSDNIEELGAYIQSTTELVPDRLDLVVAGRWDTHTFLENDVFSPRAALVLKADENNSFRFSYNRAFSTPTTLNLFLDINAGLAPDPLGGLGYNLRARGPNQGLTFTDASGNLIGMRSPFTPASLGGASQLLPVDPGVMWGLGIGVLAAQGVIDAATAALLGSLQPTAADIGINVLDPTTLQAVPLAIADIQNVGTLKESTNTTFEVGYQGVIDNHFLLAADLWYSQRKDFVSPLVLRTPLLLMNANPAGGPDMISWLTGQLMGVGLPQQVAQCQALAISIGDVDCDGTPDAAGQGGLAALPIGVVSNDQPGFSGADLIATYVNAGDVNLWGADLGAKWLVNSEWTIAGSASWVQYDYFVDQATAERFGAVSAGSPVEDAGSLESPTGRSIGALENGIAPIALNAPKWKGSLQVGYRSARSGFNAEARLRFQSEFPAESAGFVGTACVTGGTGGLFEESCVEQFTLMDVTLGYKVPGSGVTLQIAATNLFDEGYRSFVGVPQIGRFVMLQLKYDIR